MQNLQIVASGSTATFVIKLFSEKPAKLHHIVNCVVNNADIMHFVLSAEVVAPDVRLDHDSLVFALSIHNWLPHVDRTLTLTNLSDFDAKFNMLPDHSDYTVLTPTGVVTARASLGAVVRWQPAAHKVDGPKNSKLAVSIAGGARHEVCYACCQMCRMCSSCAVQALRVFPHQCDIACSAC